MVQGRRRRRRPGRAPLRGVDRQGRFGGALARRRRAHRHPRPGGGHGGCRSRPGCDRRRCVRRIDRSRTCNCGRRGACIPGSSSGCRVRPAPGALQAARRARVRCAVARTRRCAVARTIACASPGRPHGNSDLRRGAGRRRAGPRALASRAQVAGRPCHRPGDGARDRARGSDHAGRCRGGDRGRDTTGLGAEHLRRASVGRTLNVRVAVRFAVRVAVPADPPRRLRRRDPGRAAGRSRAVHQHPTSNSRAHGALQGHLRPHADGPGDRLRASRAGPQAPRRAVPRR